MLFYMPIAKEHVCSHTLVLFQDRSEMGNLNDSWSCMHTKLATYYYIIYVMVIAFESERFEWQK